MNPKPTACVIGGGIAGLSSAVFLVNAGFKVRLIEASPKLGGRAYSFFDKTLNSSIDNGQHIFASWYRDTFEYLKIIGSFDKLTFQKSLEIDFIDLSGKQFKLKCPDMKPPFHLLYGIMTYDALVLKDKLGIIGFVRKIKAGAFEEKKLKSMDTAALFEEAGQSGRLIEAFWKPFIIAVFNAEPENTSAYMFVEMIKMGFLEKGNSELVLPDDYLSNILVDPAEKYLNENGSRVFKTTAVKKLNISDYKIDSLESDSGETVKADYFISAVPFYDFRDLVGSEIFDNEYSNVGNLKYSPILNVHVKFSSPIDNTLKSRFVGILGATVQWIFKVSVDHLCLVISSAKELAEKDKDVIIELCKNELFKCLPELKNNGITGIRVIKEMRATFVPDNVSLDSRPDNKTKFSNFFIAGDWTNTGLPSTIEGAVRSAKKCVNEILNK